MIGANRNVVISIATVLALSTVTLFVTVVAQAQDRTSQESSLREGTVDGPSAEERTGSATGKESLDVGEGKYCVESLDKGAPPPKCYKTFRKQMSVATGGTITNADTMQEFEKAMVQEEKETSSKSGNRATSSMEVLSVMYVDSGFRGKSYASIASKGCDNNGGFEYADAYVGDEHNDRISSYETFNKCQVKHFEDSDFSGRSTGVSGSDRYIGDRMNDRTSSIKWY